MPAEPLTVTATLATPPIADRPIFFDGLLLAGLGEEMGVAQDTWVAAAEVVAAFEAADVLARVETSAGWWWAASAALPRGPESIGHLNRVPLVEEAGRWTQQRSLNQAAGPDKRLRVPYFARPGWLSITWTCVGDARRVALLLERISGVGRIRGHGHGWVTRWDVVRGGPPLAAYRTDLRLRHLPVALEPTLPPGRVMRRSIPLRPPYYARAEAVPVWQVTS